MTMIMMKMKKLASCLAVGASVLMAAGWADAQTDSRFCTNALLRGDFAFSVEGYKLGGPVAAPSAPCAAWP